MELVTTLIELSHQNLQVSPGLRQTNSCDRSNIPMSNSLRLSTALEILMGQPWIPACGISALHIL